MDADVKTLRLLARFGFVWFAGVAVAEVYIGSFLCAHKNTGVR